MADLDHIRRRTAERKAAGANQTYPQHTAAPATGVPSAPSHRFALPVCPLRGEPTGETRDCPTCSGTVRIKLLACSLHGECTDSKLIAGVYCCRTCPDRQSPA